MRNYILLLRGINVGGKNKLPMQELRTILAELGAINPHTYIQSGNAVFQSRDVTPPLLEQQIASRIQERSGFKPELLLIPEVSYRKILVANPFIQAAADGKTLHLGFLARNPVDPDIPKLDSLQAPGETYRLKERTFYLHAPAGIGKSKLAAGAEKVLGVPMTLRNWNSCLAIQDLAGSLDSGPMV